jgi:hypothetical protein
MGSSQRFQNDQKLLSPTGSCTHTTITGRASGVVVAE